MRTDFSHLSGHGDLCARRRLGQCDPLTTNVFEPLARRASHKAKRLGAALALLALTACSSLPDLSLRNPFNRQEPAGQPADTRLRQPGVVPTLVEPQLAPGQPPHAPLGRGWYVDTLTGSASMQFINQSKIAPDGPRMTLRELQDFRGLDKSGLMDVLDLAYMPSLVDVALIARLAAGEEARDAEAFALLQTLEQQGHALATAARLNPQEAAFVAESIQGPRERWNVKAARAARGDAAALKELEALAARVKSSDLGKAALTATRALVTAQHNLRLKERLQGRSNASFFVLRSPSFDTALQGLADHAGASASVGNMACLLLGGSCNVSPGAQPSPLAKCFVLERDGRWDAAEVAAHRKSCDPKEVAKKKENERAGQLCIRPGLVEAMNALMNGALSDPAYANRLALYRSQGIPPIKGFSLQGAAPSEPPSADQPFRCSMAAKPIFAEAERQDSGAAERVLRQSLVWIDFRGEPAGGQRVRLRLVSMFGGDRPVREYVSPPVTTEPR